MMEFPLAEIWAAGLIVVLSLLVSAILRRCRDSLHAGVPRPHAEPRTCGRPARHDRDAPAANARAVRRHDPHHQQYRADRCRRLRHLDVDGIQRHHRGALCDVGVSVLAIVFAEMLPKAIATAIPESVALYLARPMSWVVAVLGPVTIGIERVVRLMLLPFGLNLGENAPILSANQELRDQLDLLHEEGGVAKIQRDMLGGLLDLEDLSVSEVMIHRTKMRTINADLTAQEIVREVLSSPYTRMPLWRDSQENIIGVLHAKDLLRALDNVGGDADRLSIEEIALESWFVPDTTSLRDQLKAFLAKKTHFALVVDEYGEVMGLVTLEDILEEIVGDIKDEHDLSIQGVRPQPNGAVNVDGSVTIRDLNRVMDWNLPDDEATTVAGLVIHEARTIPETGQIFTSTATAFTCCANRATASPCCASCRWRRSA